MNKKHLLLYGIALLSMQSYASSAEFIARQDNTIIVSQEAKKVYQCQCPAVKDRLFTSQIIEAEIARVKKLLTNPKLAWMFENCFPNTLDTTVHFRDRRKLHREAA